MRLGFRKSIADQRPIFFNIVKILFRGVKRSEEESQEFSISDFRAAADKFLISKASMLVKSACEALVMSKAKTSQKTVNREIQISKPHKL